MRSRLRSTSRAGFQQGLPGGLFAGSPSGATAPTGPSGTGRAAQRCHVFKGHLERGKPRPRAAGERKGLAGARVLQRQGLGRGGRRPGCEGGPGAVGGTKTRTWASLRSWGCPRRPRVQRAVSRGRGRRGPGWRQVRRGRTGTCQGVGGRGRGTVFCPFSVNGESLQTRRRGPAALGLLSRTPCGAGSRPCGDPGLWPSGWLLRFLLGAGWVCTAQGDVAVLEEKEQGPGEGRGVAARPEVPIK